MTPDPDTLGAPEPLHFEGWRGARDERVPASLIEAAVAGRESHPIQTLKSDHRSSVIVVATEEYPMVLKEVRKAGARRRLADAFRGSPARRAWTAGRRLIGAGIGAALPLAYLEQRMFGTPVRSVLVSVDLRDVPTAADRLADAGQREVVLAGLADLVVALHRLGSIHGDLRAQHVHMDTTPRLIDLESIRFYARLSDPQRIEDLVQLNASIADELASESERRAAFARYSSALPFQADSADVLAEIDRASITRGHLYRGNLCRGNLDREDGGATC